MARRRKWRRACSEGKQTGPEASDWQPAARSNLYAAGGAPLGLAIGMAPRLSRGAARRLAGWLAGWQAGRPARGSSGQRGGSRRPAIERRWRQLWPVIMTATQEPRPPRPANKRPALSHSSGQLRAADRAPAAEPLVSGPLAPRPPAKARRTRRPTWRPAPESVQPLEGPN